MANNNKFVDLIQSILCVCFVVDGGMYVTTGEEGEQAAAIASVAQGGTLTLDPTVQYQFRADGSGDLGKCMYRCTVNR